MQPGNTLSSQSKTKHIPMDYMTTRYPTKTIVRKKNIGDKFYNILDAVSAHTTSDEVKNTRV